MKKAAVIYWSGTGNTEAMANAVLEGMKSAGADAVLLTASDVDGSAVGGYDAVALGIISRPWAPKFWRTWSSSRCSTAANPA